MTAEKNIRENIHGRTETGKQKRREIGSGAGGGLTVANGGTIWGLILATRRELMTVH
jgi:hypothetical protein